MLARMMGAARLNVATFEDVENDKGATIQAMMVVVLVSIAGGIGGILTYGILGLVLGLVGGLIQWALWAMVTFLIGTTFSKRRKPMPIGVSWREPPVLPKLQVSSRCSVSSLS